MKKIILFIIAIVMCSASSAYSMSNLEKSYIVDANHALYAYIVNKSCHYIPSKQFNLTSNIITNARNIVGKTNMDAYDAGEGRAVLIENARINNYLMHLNNTELKAVCLSHKKEFNNIYKYLVKLSNKIAKN